MKVSKCITITDCFRSHEFEVSVNVDLEDIRCAIREDKQSEQGVLQSFSDFIRFSQSVPDEIYAEFNDHIREVIGDHLETILAKVRG